MKGLTVSRFTGFLVFVSLAASAEDATMPSVALAEIRFRQEDFENTRRDVKEKLEQGFNVALKRQGVAVATKAQVQSYIANATRKDWAEDDGALVKLATDSSISVQYGMYVFVWLEAEGEDSRLFLKMSARVVRKNGWKARDVVVKVPRGVGKLLVPFNALTTMLFEELALAKLPFRSEATPPTPPAPPMVMVPTPDAVLDEAHAQSPGVPPVVVKKSEPSVLRPAGYVALIVGGAAAIGGLVTFFAAPQVHKDGVGNVDPTDFGRLHIAYARQSAGVGLIVSGAVVAAAGGALLLLVSNHDSAVKVSWAPASGGASLFVGGSF